MNKYVPDRYDVVWLDLDPQKGREVTKRRPFLTLSPRAYNAKVGLLIGCPITSQVKGYPFEVLVKAAKNINGAVLADQVKSLDWRERHAAYITRVEHHIAEQVSAYLKLLLESS